MRRRSSCEGYCLAMGLFTLVAVAQTNQAADDVPVLTDYAYGWQIEPQAAADFYEILLPLEVYRSVTDRELRDVGVYNASGTAVPRVVRQEPEDAAAPERKVALKPLPVLTRAGVAPGDVRLSLERSEAGTKLSLESAPADAAEPQVLVAYVIDLTDSEQPPLALELEWPPELEPFITRLEVEGSDDLEQWQALGSGTIAALRQDEASIERRRIALSGREARYLRVTWRNAPAGWRLIRILACYSDDGTQSKRESLTLAPVDRDSVDGGHIYDTGGAVLIDRLSVDLPGDNVVVRASLYEWRAAEERWVLAHNGLFYHLRSDGEALRNEPVAVAPRRAPRWKVVVERGRRELAPTLTLGWRPDRLLFVAEGEGPWRLVAGNAADRELGYPQQRLFGDPEIYELLEHTPGAAAATLGPRQELGGPSRLQAPRVLPWRRWLLWLGLTAGVLVVASMAVRLWRQLRSERTS